MKSILALLFLGYAATQTSDCTLDNEVCMEEDPENCCIYLAYTVITENVDYESYTCGARGSVAAI